MNIHSSPTQFKTSPNQPHQKYRRRLAQRQLQTIEQSTEANIETNGSGSDSGNEGVKCKDEGVQTNFSYGQQDKKCKHNFKLSLPNEMNYSPRGISTQILSPFMQVSVRRQTTADQLSINSTRRKLFNSQRYSKTQSQKRQVNLAVLQSEQSICKESSIESECRDLSCTLQIASVMSDKNQQCQTIEALRDRFKEQQNQNRRIKLFCKKAVYLKDPIKAIKKLYDNSNDKFENVERFLVSQQSTRRKEESISGTTNNQESSVQSSETYQHLIPYQSVKLQNYYKVKQYDQINLPDRILYPTLNNIEPQCEKSTLVLKAHCKRIRRIPNLDRLPYREQKQFFRLDNEYEQIFVDQHSHKIKPQKDHLSKVLKVQLKQECQKIIKKQIQIDQRFDHSKLFKPPLFQ